MGSIGGLLPVTDGTVVVYVNRTTTDQLGEFRAFAKQAIGRNLLAKSNPRQLRRRHGMGSSIGLSGA